eukprot:g32288.t1
MYPPRTRFFPRPFATIFFAQLFTREREFVDFYNSDDLPAHPDRKCWVNLVLASCTGAFWICVQEEIMLSSVDSLFFDTHETFVRETPQPHMPTVSFHKSGLPLPPPISRSQSAPVPVSSDDEGSLNSAMKQLLLKRALGHATPTEERELLDLMQRVLKADDDDILEGSSPSDFNLYTGLPGIAVDSNSNACLDPIIVDDDGLPVTPALLPASEPPTLPSSVFRDDPFINFGHENTKLSSGSSSSYSSASSSYSSASSLSSPPSSPMSPLYSSPPSSPPSSWSSEQGTIKEEDSFWVQNKDVNIWNQESSDWTRKDQTLWNAHVQEATRVSRSVSAPPLQAQAQQQPIYAASPQLVSQFRVLNVNTAEVGKPESAAPTSRPSSPDDLGSEDGRASDMDTPDEQDEDQPAPAPPPFFVSKPAPTVKSVTAIPKPRRRRKHAALFGCPYPDCGQSFPTRFSLKRHQKRHTGERPFQCDIPGCNRRFAEKSTLDRHRRSAAHTGGTQNIVGMGGFLGVRRPNEKAGSPKRRKTSIKERAVPAAAPVSSAQLFTSAETMGYRRRVSS